MKKTLIIILIIVILGGLGYFAYTKGLINFDFLKKINSVPVSEEIKNDQKATDVVEKIDPKFLGEYYGARNHFTHILLKSDGTFVYYLTFTNRFKDSHPDAKQAKITGKFLINGTNIKFVYDPQLNNEQPDKQFTIGENADSVFSIGINDNNQFPSLDKNAKYINEDSVKYDLGLFVLEEKSCDDLLSDVQESSNLIEKSELYKHAKQNYLSEIYTLLDRIENNTIFINIRLNGQIDKKTGEVLSNGGTLAWLTLDMDKEVLTMMPPNEGEKGTILDFDKDIVDEIRIACKK